MAVTSSLSCFFCLNKAVLLSFSSCQEGQCSPQHLGDPRWDFICSANICIVFGNPKLASFLAVTTPVLKRGGRLSPLTCRLQPRGSSEVGKGALLAQVHLLFTTILRPLFQSCPQSVQLWGLLHPSTLTGAREVK